MVNNITTHVIIVRFLDRETQLERQTCYFASSEESAAGLARTLAAKVINVAREDGHPFPPLQPVGTLRPSQVLNVEWAPLTGVSSGKPYLI